MRDVLVIFPKESSYTNKAPNAKYIQRSLYNEWLELFSKHCNLISFAEDVMAYMVYQEFGYKHSLISVLTDYDKKILCNDKCNYVLRPDIQTVECNKLSLPSFTKPKFVQRASFKSDEEFVLGTIDSVYTNMRNNIQKVLERSSNTLYFKSGTTNFCRSVYNECTIGDGKLYVQVDVNNAIFNIKYGGIEINKDMLESLLSMGGNK